MMNGEVRMMELVGQSRTIAQIALDADSASENAWAPGSIDALSSSMREVPRLCLEKH